MSEKNEVKILSSWRKNVSQWTQAIENGEIASRQQITNQAILDAVFASQVSSLIDIGCGEGWLVRAVAARGVDALGIDGVKLFIDNQLDEKNTQYLHIDYDSLSPQLFTQHFDVAVCNFSLLGDSSVCAVLRQIPALLSHPSGRLIIQTLHPEFSTSKDPGKSGWRTGSWAGFCDSFVDPAPWYFRTVHDWLGLFEQNQLEVSSIVEPRADTSSDPVSIIFNLNT